ncbi:VQ domain-containing protein [Dioscorea alata]|uniref:VQ domain-containing protein n=1 Tax=Dioscorea alata TaxID=55571 RepID=A0ACB7TS62_DIOAL|nr:VQ domain-containing protein [Dioscorea alata]
METHPNLQDREIPSPNSSSGSSSNNHRSPVPAPTTPPTPPPKPPTPRSVDANPYPTTFVQADTSSFKHVVQMLTGSAETAAKHAASNPKTSTPPPPSPSPATKPPGPKKPAFKLYERRSSMKNLKMISPLGPAFLHPGPVSPITAFSPRKQPEILSPSMLDFPSLVLSPVTPLIPDPFNRSPAPSSASSLSAEDRAIAEKGFYLHPSPRSTPRDGEPPRLLPLFPVTSPRVSP